MAQPFVFSIPVPKLWVPRPCVLCKGGYDAACTILFVMPSGLHRTYGAHRLHFITSSCYRQLPLLRTARSRDRFLSILEQTRQRYRLYPLNEAGPVGVNEEWAEILFRVRGTRGNSGGNSGTDGTFPGFRANVALYCTSLTFPLRKITFISL